MVQCVQEQGRKQYGQNDVIVNVGLLGQCFTFLHTYHLCLLTNVRSYFKNRTGSVDDMHTWDDSSHV